MYALIVMAPLEILELLVVLAVIGLLMVLGVRLRVRSHTAILLIIVGLLLLALMSLGKTLMSLFGIVVVLLVSLIVLVFRQSFANRLLGGESNCLRRSYPLNGGFR